MLHGICLVFCQFKPVIAYKSVAYRKKTCISRENQKKKNGHFQLMSLTETYQFFSLIDSFGVI